MRVNAVTDVDSRDGVSNKDERLTNMIAEKDGHAILACIRPALNTIVSSSGAGKGVTCFNSTDVFVMGTTLYRGETPTSIGAVSGTSMFDFTQLP